MTPIRIYIDKVSNFFFIEGVASGPVSDFQVTTTGNTVSVYRPSTGHYELRYVDFSNIVRTDGTSFASSQEVADYITIQLVPTVTQVAYPLYFDQADQGILKLDKDDLSDGGSF